MGLGLAAGALLLKATGASPFLAYRAMLLGGLGDKAAVTETLVKAIPLMIVSSGLCVAFRCRFWNIGAEGQICVGSIAFSWLALHIQGLPRPLALPLLLLASGAAGGAYAALCGLLRTHRGVHEIITTIMMNYVAIYGISFLVHGPMMDPAGQLPVSAEIPVSARLFPLIPATRLHSGLFLALLCPGILSILLYRTPFGFEISAAGANPRAAACAGIPVKKTLIFAAILSGLTAGLAGGVEVAGVHFKLMEGLSGGVGFVAIAVALLGRTHPWGAGLVSLLLALFQVGADRMQRELHLPSSVILLIEGLVVLCALTGETLRQRRGHHG